MLNDNLHLVGSGATSLLLTWWHWKITNRPSGWIMSSCVQPPYTSGTDPYVVALSKLPQWQIPAHLFYLAKNSFLLWGCGYYSIKPQCVGLIDVVFSTLLLHTTPHPYHLSSTAQQQVWLSSQTIRTIHITTHDRHKLSRPHRPTAYSNVPGVLPGCQLRYQQKLRTHPMDLCDIQQSSYVKQ